MSRPGSADLLESLGVIFRRDLASLAAEVRAYELEPDLWRVPPGIANSAGTLVLHLTGNLRHFVGATLGGTRYIRDRPAEFACRDAPREELLAAIEETSRAVERTLASLKEDDLARPFPDRIGNVSVATGDFLLHLAVHLGYHLGQIDYHRRLVTGNATTVGAVSPAELATARGDRPA